MGIGNWQVCCLWAVSQRAGSFSKREVGLLFGVQLKNEWDEDVSG